MEDRAPEVLMLGRMRISELAEMGKEHGAPTTRLDVLCALGYEDSVAEPLLYADKTPGIRHEDPYAHRVWEWMRGGAN